MDLLYHILILSKKNVHITNSDTFKYNVSWKSPIFGSCNDTRDRDFLPFYLNINLSRTSTKSIFMYILILIIYSHDYYGDCNFSSTYIHANPCRDHVLWPIWKHPTLICSVTCKIPQSRTRSYQKLDMYLLIHHFLPENNNQNKTFKQT